MYTSVNNPNLTNPTSTTSNTSSTSSTTSNATSNTNTASSTPISGKMKETPTGANTPSPTKPIGTVLNNYLTIGKKRPSENKKRNKSIAKRRKYQLKNQVTSATLEIQKDVLDILRKMIALNEDQQNNALQFLQTTLCFHFPEKFLLSLGPELLKDLHIGEEDEAQYKYFSLFHLLTY